jgi:hypothetical protein
MRLLPPAARGAGEFAIRAARSFDIPFSLSFSYCFSFLTLGRFPGIGTPLRSQKQAEPGFPGPACL